MSNLDNPILVEVKRGGYTESVHRGSAVVVNSSGEVIFSVGSFEQMIFPRSALKPFQVIPLVELETSVEISGSQIALACASHRGEAIHTDAVAGWLTKLGVTTNDLECGPALPADRVRRHGMIRSGEKPASIYHECSGKHVAMMALARAIESDGSVAGYSNYEHPVQKRWMQSLTEIAGVDVADLEWEHDGCGTPAIRMPMNSLALGFAQLAKSRQNEVQEQSQGTAHGSRGKAMARVVRAMQDHPMAVAGSGDCCSEVIKQTKGSVVVKSGVEGVYGGCLPELDTGFVLKIDDGAVRGSEVALGALLETLGVVTPTVRENLAPWFNPNILNSRGEVTSVIAPTVWSSLTKIS